MSADNNGAARSSLEALLKKAGAFEPATTDGHGFQEARECRGTTYEGICGVCGGYEVEHVLRDLRGELQRATRQQARLREALVNLVGVDGRAELEQMEATLRLMPGPAEDMAAAIDGVHALLATLPDAEAALSLEEPAE